MIKVKKVNEKAKLPLRNNNTDAGADVFSVENKIIRPLSRSIIDTGLIIELDDPNTYIRIAPRSGLAVKYGVDVLAGVVDFGYRGTIGVVIYNTDTNKSFEIKEGDRIAQLIIETCHRSNFVEVDEVSNTERSDKGFGSSGTT